MFALLDTHIWLWYLLEDGRLSARQRQMIEDPDVELFLSPVSVWEALLLVERKRIPVEVDAVSWIDQALRALPVREAPLTSGIARRSRRISLAHNDPADRFIAATALELGALLLTADERMVDCTELTCV